MIVQALIENTKQDEALTCEHGLSVLIQTKSHRVLFDTGASDQFVENAKMMRVDLKDVDVAVLSHGHYDHGGGLLAFLEINKNASVYVQRHAFDGYYADRPGDGTKYIGVDPKIAASDRIILIDDGLVIDDQLELFSGVPRRRLNPSGNQELYRRSESGLIADDFIHEQNLVVRENGKTLLVAGCAHSGIVNILDYYNELYGASPDWVIGGFHLYSRGSEANEDPNLVATIAENLQKTGAMFYTGHCTGIESYHHLKEIMRDQIDYLSTGMRLELT